MRPSRLVLAVAPFLPIGMLYGVALVLPMAAIVVNAAALGPADWGDLLHSSIVANAVRNTLADSLVIAVAGTVLAYLLAAAIWRAGPSGRVVLIALVIIPFWTSVLVKIVAWQAILRDNGLVNTILLRLGLIDTPLVLLHAPVAVMLAMIQFVLPFAVFPLLGVMLRLDPQLERAADSLGARPIHTFRWVILPLTAPGIAAAFTLILVICAGFYVIPATLGGPADGFVSNVVAVYALQLVDFNTASAIGVVLVIAVALLSLLYARIARAAA